MATATVGLEKDIFALPNLPAANPQNDLAESQKDSYDHQPTPLPPHARQKWYQWFSPDDTPPERKLLLKLDGLIMVFVFLAYWAKTLDSSATSTAYVSGMKEDLGLFGNQLNYLNTVYT